MTRVLAINGSYRDDGVTDRAVLHMLQVLQAAGADTEQVLLREYPIEFCHNCRACTQEPGDAPGRCVIDDDMAELVKKIEAADAFILASPVNYGSATAVFKRFMERLTVYAYWPWGQWGPTYRKDKLPPKKAVLVTSSAAPRLIGYFAFHLRSQMKMAARTMGAKPVGMLYTGTVSQEPAPPLPERTQRRAEKLARNLLG